VSDRVIIEQTNNPVLVDGQSDAVLVQGEMRVLVTLAGGPQGVAGRPGADGPAGPAGPPGSSFEFSQPSASDTWVIPHNLDAHPSVTVVDSSGRIIEGSIVYDSRNQLTVTFSAAFAGSAYLN
jgi:hypothetical protein